MAIQLLLAAGLLLALWWLLDITAANMRERGIRSGFDFLFEPAGFGIGESLLPFDSADSAWWALAAGLANTLRVAVPAILISTLLGTLVGLGRDGSACIPSGGGPIATAPAETTVAAFQRGRTD